MEIWGSFCKRRRDSVDFPAPDGEDTTSIRPRRAMSALILNLSFDVLYLLAKLIDHGFQREPDMGELNIRGFRTQSIRLPVKFLCKEIEFAPSRLLAGDQRARL